MTTLFFVATLILLALSLVYLHRIAVGPTVFDRLVGVNAFGTKATIALVLVGGVYDRVDMFVDIALGYAVLAFVGSLAAARYFERAAERR
jgi:multicomponent Na+:H+ antiporter subunit F